MTPLIYKLIPYWPPYFGAGIYIDKLNKQGNDMTIAMKLRFYNKNGVRTHFGGSLYSMCDPWYMFIISAHLGKDYIVWDKAASIKFKKPGLGKVHARFYLSTEQLEEIKRQVDNNEATDFELTCEVLSESGEVVAEVHKTLYANTKANYKARLAERKKKSKETTSA